MPKKAEYGIKILSKGSDLLKLPEKMTKITQILRTLGFSPKSRNLFERKSNQKSRKLVDLSIP